MIMFSGDQGGIVEDCSLPKYYNGQSLFVTGGTGFVGKVLLFKLLKSCSDIKHIYVLMRPKCGDSVKERLNKLINGQVFSKLKDRSALQKIIPIKGDVSQPCLGISESDKKILVDNVSIVFHLAGTVRFDETLKTSVVINVLGTLRLVEFCHTMIKLDALIYVSTAYSNCDKQEIAEIVYPFSFNPETIIQSIEWMDDELINVLTPKFLGSHLNTYTFTKALAEQVIISKRGNLPCIIVRPSIILSSLFDPEPGWVDSWHGLNTLIAALSRGTIRSIQIFEENIIDIIPVDFVVNLMICSAWYTANTKPNSVLVYNCCSGHLNSINWKTFADRIILSLQKYPSVSLLMKPNVKYYRNTYLNWFSNCFRHVIPAVVFDFLMNNFLRKPSYEFKFYKKFSAQLTLFQFIMLHEWHFNDANVRSLQNVLAPQDENEFSFNVTEIDWHRLIDDYVLGIRTYVLKENPATILEALRRQQRIANLERICDTVMSFLTVISLIIVWVKKSPYFRYWILRIGVFMFFSMFNAYVTIFQKYFKV